MVNIYRIGEFALKVNSSVQTIRYYDEIGLLKPKEIDNFTSYRYYNDDNINEYYVIMLLKELGFSLEEIKISKDSLSDEVLLNKRKRIVNNILKEKETIKLIDNIRSNIVEGKIKLEKYDYEIQNIITRKKG